MIGRTSENFFVSEPLVLWNIGGHVGLEEERE